MKWRSSTIVEFTGVDSSSGATLAAVRVGAINVGITLVAMRLLDRGYPAQMRIDEILAAKRPVFSVEFFPPKSEEAREQLFATARSLRELEPDFVSVTYGAGGSTRDGTVEITRALKDDLGLETMAHLSCVGETTEGLSATLDRIVASEIENVFALRGDPPRGEADFVQPAGGLGSA
ncbi:MAG: methylenetetrahydrofolate reductase, partial [Solirubrobacterales bacterium]